MLPIAIQVDSNTVSWYLSFTASETIFFFFIVVDFTQILNFEWLRPGWMLRSFISIVRLNIHDAFL